MKNFRSFSVTHKGAKHEQDVPCQDASAYFDCDTAAIAVVADGHGSTRCFRSDIGSGKAVEIAKNSVASFVSKTPELPREMTTQFIGRREVDISESKIILNNMVREIIDKWFAAVMQDEEEYPLKDDQRLEGLVQKYKDRYINDVDYRCHAYGTTLIAAVICENYWFGFQVGDGKCVVLYEDGSWDLPIPWDDKCMFNTTTSICDDDSLSRFRYWFGVKNEKDTFTEFGYGVNGEGKDYTRENKSRPLAVFIASDGVEDSYPRIDNDKYVINFYRNRIVSLAENGYAAFNQEIDGFTKRFADRESTDDVSIAGIIGDFSGKADMIAKMKHDSEIHEASEMASVKRRDANEKKDALDAVQKRTEAITANLRNLESRIVSAESELAELNAKKASYESDFTKSKTKIETSDRSMTEYQSKLRELERNRSEYVRNEQILSAKSTYAEDDERKAKRAFENARNEYQKKEDSLFKKKEAYEKYLNKLALGKPQTGVIEQIQKFAVKTANHYDNKGNNPDQANQPAPINSAPQPNAPVNDSQIDAKEEWFKQEIEKTSVELQTLQAQILAARQNAEAKGRELSGLRKQFFDSQQLTRQAEFEINRVKQDYRTAEALNRNQREAVRLIQSDIAEIERAIKSKQAELDKLNGELESFKEQTKKQTDTLAQIESAWEQAEAEAKAFEAIIRNS